MERQWPDGQFQELRTRDSVSFADSIPQFSMVVPRLRTVPPLAARCSAPADFASLRVLGAPAASRPPLLASSLVVLPASLGSSYRPALRWPGISGLRRAYFALLRAQRARFVRPLDSKGSLLARRSRDRRIDQRGARRPSVAGSFSLAQQHLAIRANRSPLPTGRLPGR